MISYFGSGILYNSGGGGGCNGPYHCKLCRIEGNEEKEKEFNLPRIRIDVNIVTSDSLMMFRNKFRNIGKLEEEIEDVDREIKNEGVPV